MAAIVKTPSGTWKAVNRHKGWPATSMTSRTKRDAKDRSRRAEGEITRQVYAGLPIRENASPERPEALPERDNPTKRPSTQRAGKMRAKPLIAQLGKYALVSLTPDVIAAYRDERLEEGRRASTVRLEPALLGHLYTTAIKEWGLGLTYNPVSNIHRLHSVEEPEAFREQINI